MTSTERSKIVFRFSHHCLGVDIEAQIAGGEWQFVELVPARNFRTIEEQWAFPKKYMESLNTANLP